MENETSKRSLGAVFNMVKPYVAMISLRFGYAGMFIITMVSLNRGMSHYVLVVYRHAFATAVIAPFAFILDRKVRPAMTFSTFIKIMVLGFLEPVLDQNLYYVGMKSTSATYASAIFNVLPAITFIMAIIFRMEKVKIKKVHSQAKVLGTMLTVAGAMVMTVYKGPLLDFVWSRGQSHQGTSSSQTDTNWFKGTFMLLSSCTGWSAFFIVQSYTLRTYPAELSLTALICLMGMVQSAAVALVMERDGSAWAIGWDSRLLAAVYSGVVCSGITYYVQGVVIKERGPVFVTAFNPLCMVIVAVLGSFILAEQVYLGSVIGAVIIVVGLYSVVWGKSKDHLSSPSLDAVKKNVIEELPVSTIDTIKAKSNECISEGTVMPEILHSKISLT